MKIEKILVLAFTFLGLFTGIVSNYISEASISILVALAIYCLSVFSMTKFVKEKKKKKLILNSFVTFILVWLVVWIFLFNLG